MRKVLAFLLAVSFFVVAFSGCNKTREPNVWDGSIAETFAEGDGSEKNPYTIEKASQLALLAQEINAGTDYNGKYISLNCDLDLNDCEWTPIGNGVNPFNGVFNGNNHTISNLKITKGTIFTTENSSGEIKQFTTGLFGSCYDATIKNIIVDEASIFVQNITDSNAIMGGVLVGTMRTDLVSEMSNINVMHSDITCEFEVENNTSVLQIGGIVGYIYGNDESSIKMNNINSDTTVSIENGRASYNFVGGISGATSTNNLFNVNNCASYLAIDINNEHSYLQHNLFGAFGSMQTKNDIVSVSNIFSKVIINKIYDISHGYSAYDAYAIIGETNHVKQKDGTRIGGYEFKNLFGYVEQIDESFGEMAKSMQLYELSSYVVHTETNCLGCESLPTDHGFDTSFWELTDLSKPKVKIN